MNGKILIVTAHLKEAKLLAASLSGCVSGPLPYRYSAPGMVILVAGQGEESLRRSLVSLPLTGIRVLLLFGTAGSLTTVYAPGMVLECPWVHTLEGDILVSPLSLGLPRASILAVPGPVIDPAEREELFREHGTLLVDMESGGFVKIVKERGLPWAVVKVVSDTPSEPDTFPFSVELDTLLRENARVFLGGGREVFCDH